jgi:hypothetical protein
MLIKHFDVTYKKRDYVVCFVNHGDNKLIPFVIDADDKERVLAIDSWYYQNKRSGYIAYPVRVDGKDQKIYLHNFIMNFVPTDRRTTVDHINRVGMDNRKKNLRIATIEEQNKNMKKTCRKKSLEEMGKQGIDIKYVPRFVTFVKENEYKSDYFQIQINHKSLYESSSQTDFSLKFKFEQTKKIMRSLMESNPELFEGVRLNWTLTEEGLKLRKRYNKILKLTEVENIKDYYAKTKCPTFVKCLEENLDGLTDREIALLEDTELRDDKPQRITDSSALKELGITVNDLPKFVHYNASGNFFRIVKHPKLKEKYNKDEWRTSQSKYVTVQEGYQQLVDKLVDLEIEPPKPRNKVRVV